MITAVLDTNILVRGAIASHPMSASKRIIDALFVGRFSLVLSADAFQEIQRVLNEPVIVAKHGRSKDEILNLCRALEILSRLFEPTTYIPASLTRDVTDTKWVALALASQADYLVTADRRHLLRLRNVGKTKIIRPWPFLQLISSGTN